MDKVKDIQVAVLGVCLLVGMLVGSFVIAGTLVKVKRNDVLSVTGAASQLITSDHASWSCSVARQSGSLASAYEALKVDLNAVKAYLVKNGFAEKDIKVSGVSRSELYARDNRGYSTNDIEAYVMRQTITVASDDVNKIDAIARQSTELLADGIGFTSNEPQYIYTKLDDLKVDMIGKATQNAKERAASMAKNTGNKIGSLRSANTGVFQITPPDSTDVSDYGINDTSSIEKKITAVVNVTFAVE